LSQITAPRVRPERAPGPIVAPVSDASARRNRVAFRIAAFVVAAYVALPLLACFTSALDATVGGIGIAYVIGFGEVVIALTAATLYRSWANRLDAEAGR
jgi:uncharacterized membrane protein (DUF485 family)